MFEMTPVWLLCPDGQPGTDVRGPTPSTVASLRISEKDSVQVHGLPHVEYCWLDFDTHFILVLMHRQGYLIMP